MLGFCSIKVDYVQTLETYLLKLLGYFGRRVAIDRLLVVVAFGQSYALPSDDVDGGNQL